ncbi:hypothetical protein Pen02_19180 [Plantactinospora endophytica]|uniref:Uncharacterized protein n=1 Tax=Plantactinospora endophytica TaxID=673535 RepID=A0ABQ4DX00_9ACTN|nr:hypothetical protein Pen02_19180 [Plantactinospora endophytica]
MRWYIGMLLKGWSPAGEVGGQGGHGVPAVGSSRGYGGHGRAAVEVQSGWTAGAGAGRGRAAGRDRGTSPARDHRSLAY